MSRKHDQRTRAEILDKRARPVKEWAGWRVLGGAPAVIATSPIIKRTRYMPHFGNKQAAKIAARETKLKLAA